MDANGYEEDSEEDKVNNGMDINGDVTSLHVSELNHFSMAENLE